MAFYWLWDWIFWKRFSESNTHWTSCLLRLCYITSHNTNEYIIIHVSVNNSMILFNCKLPSYECIWEFLKTPIKKKWWKISWQKRTLSKFIYTCPHNPWNSVWSYHLQQNRPHTVAIWVYPFISLYRPEQVLFNGDCNFFQFFFVCLFFNFNVYRFIVICSYDWDYSLHYLQMNIYNALQLFYIFFKWCIAKWGFFPYMHI